MEEESVEKKKLFDAAENNDLETVKIYLEETFMSPTMTNDEEQTLAHVAAKKGHLDIVKYMAERHPSVFAEKDRSQNTVFLLAVENGALDIVEYLVENHAEITEPDFLTVQTAVQCGHLNILKYYLEARKVDVNITNKLHETPLFLAVESKHPHIVDYLVEERNANLTMVDINKDNILFTTITANNLPLMKRLWDEKKAALDVNWQNRYGDTLLHRAAIMNRIDIVQYLVDEKHAQLNIQGTDMMTPLHCAACRDNYEICKFLVERGADTQIKDEEEHFPWQKAFDKHLINYLANVTTATRTRRHADNLPYSQPSVLVAHNNEFSSIFADYLIGREKNEINSFQIQSFFVVAEWILRTCGKRHLFPRFLQTQQDGIDPIVLDAIDDFPVLEES